MLCGLRQLSAEHLRGSRNPNRRTRGMRPALIRHVASGRCPCAFQNNAPTGFFGTRATLLGATGRGSCGQGPCVGPFAA